MNHAKKKTKKDRHQEKLRRCQTLVESKNRGATMLIRTYVPTQPPPGQTLPDRQVQTSISSTVNATPGEPGDEVDEKETQHYIVEHRVAMPTLEHVQYFWDREAFRSLGVEVFADTKEITESVSAFRAALKAVQRVGVEDSRMLTEDVWENCLVVVVADGGTPRTAALFATGTSAPEVHSIDPEMRRDWLVTPTSAGMEPKSGLVVGEGSPPTEPASGSDPSKPPPELLRKPGISSRLHCHRSTVEDWLLCGPSLNGATAEVKEEEEVPSSNDGANAGLAPRAETGKEVGLLLVVAVHSHVRLDDYVPALRKRTNHPRTLIVTIPCCVDQSLEETPPGGVTTPAVSTGGGGGAAEVNHSTSHPSKRKDMPMHEKSLRAAVSNGSNVVKVEGLPEPGRRQRKEEKASEQQATTTAAAATREEVAGAGWANKKARPRGKGTRKRHLAVPIEEFHDYAVFSPHRVVRVFDLASGK